MRWILSLFTVAVVLAAAGAGAVFWAFYTYGPGLPDHQRLADYKPPVVTRVHGGDGRMLAEYATQQRIFVPVSAMPQHVINAFLSAEDKTFFSHFGLDIWGLVSATIFNLRHFGTDRRMRGASTITQQVAKNFLLTNEATLERKIKEAILALRIERALSKQRILELYLNEIYLGFGAFGVAAAALNYFDKSLDELTLAEAAYLAALPKAPSNYHPLRKPEAAVARRNWVVGRMLDNGFIGDDQARAAIDRPLEVRRRSETEIVEADYFTEEVRRWVIDRFGFSQLYDGGLSVRTSLDPRLQSIAEDALRAGLEAYDRRHGWRGAISRMPIAGDWAAGLAEIGRMTGMRPAWRTAVVLEVRRDRARIGLAEGSVGEIPLSELRWARPWQEHQRLGPGVKSAASVLAPGEVVFVEPLVSDGDGPVTYGLRQIPDISGAIIALDPHTGRVLAMSGGWDYSLSEFNRATQAQRQPGSAFKPFVYLAALENGLTPATRILDAPIVVDQGVGLAKWRPSNYSGKFYGPSLLRVGIEKSRNLMTVRLARAIGMERIVDYARRFGIDDDMPPLLAMSLGAGETSLLRLTAAYAMLVNGGHRIIPTLVDQVQDRNGRTIFREDRRDCALCRQDQWSGQPAPHFPEVRERVADAAAAYQVVRMLEGVVQRGTGRTIAELGKSLAGKTGTSNDNFDSWFIGFAPDLAVGTFVGFDQPRTLGRRDTGSTVAAPIFKQFMARALEGRPSVPFRAPSGILHVRIDAGTGAPAGPDDGDVIIEAFRLGTEPDGSGQPVQGTPLDDVVHSVAPVAGSAPGLY